MEKRQLEFLTFDILKNQKRHVHRYYCHYTEKNRLIGNLKKNALYLNDGVNWPDKKDKANLNDKNSEVKRYAICFSYGLNENMGHWIVSAGIREFYDKEQNNRKQGLMMKLPKEVLFEIIERIEKVELIDDLDENKQKTTILYKEDINVYLADLYYLNNEAFNSQYDEDCLATVSEKHYYLKKNDHIKTKHLSKAFGWKYENEVRLIVEINKRKRVDNYHYLKIEIPEDIGKKIFKEYLYNDPTHYDKKYQKSQLNDTVNFDQLT